MKKFIFTVFIIIFTIQLYAQDNGFYEPESERAKETRKLQRQKKLEKWAFGGNFRLSFGTSSYVELSPVFLYRAHPRLLVGSGFTYIYTKSNYYNYENSTYGPKAIAIYTLFANINEKININVGNIVIHSEFEYLNFEPVYVVSQGVVLKEDKTWISNLLVGGGIYQPLGGKGGISLTILFNVIESRYTTYKNPIFRFGFYF